jgi:hypothetical protein
LLCSEAGPGDTLQFCLYAGLSAAQDAIVFLEVQPPLIGLLANRRRVWRPERAELAAASKKSM